MSPPEVRHVVGARRTDFDRSQRADRLGHALATWTQRHEDHDERTARHERDRSFPHRVESDGMVSFTIRLAPDEAAEALPAVEATMMRRSREAKSQDAAEAAAESGEDASAGASDSLEQQRADAFVLVTDGGVSIEAEVVLHVRGDGCIYDETGHTTVEETRLRCAPCHRRRHARGR